MLQGPMSQQTNHLAHLLPAMQAIYFCSYLFFSS